MVNQNEAGQLALLLDRGRYTEEEWDCAVSGLCGWEIEYGMSPGSIVRCELPSHPESFYRYCAEHDRDCRETYPDTYGK